MFYQEGEIKLLPVFTSETLHNRIEIFLVICLLVSSKVECQPPHFPRFCVKPIFFRVAAKFQTLVCDRADKLPKTVI